MTTEVPIIVKDIDGLAVGHRVVATCVSGGTAAHGVDGEVIEARRGVVGTVLNLPAVDELVPAGCYWRVTARTWTWNIQPLSTTPAPGGEVLVGEPSIQATSTAPPATWPTGSRLPAGGTAGQVLGKVSGTDFDVSWRSGGGGGGGAVDSVNGQTGVVVLGAADVGADAVGAAAAATASAVQKAANLSDVASAATALSNLGGVATGDARLSDARTPTAHAASHASAGSDAVTIAESQVTNLVTDLAAKIPTTAKAAASGVASLDGSTKVPIAQIPTGQTASTVPLGDDARFAGIATNAQTGTTYTLVLADAGKAVECSNASPVTLTIPTNASVAFPVGTTIQINQTGAGTLTVAAAGGVTIRSLGSKVALAGQYAGASIRQRAANEWVLVGALA